jgi:hypothetical protein
VLTVVIPDKFIKIGIPLHNFPGVMVEEHRNMSVGEALSENGKKREGKNNIAKSVRTDNQDPLRVCGNSSGAGRQ